MEPAVDGRSHKEPDVQSSSASGGKEWGPNTKVTEQTLDVVCLGHLALLVPPSDSWEGSQPSPAASSSSATAWSQCRFRCEGVTFKVEQVMSTNRRMASAPEAVSRDHEVSAAPRAEGAAAEGRSLQPFANKEFGSAAMRGMEAIAGRASAILSAVGTGAGSSLERIGNAAPSDALVTVQRVYTQAVKIAKRSAQQAAWVVGLPQRAPAGTSGALPPSPK